MRRTYKLLIILALYLLSFRIFATPIFAQTDDYWSNFGSRLKEDKQEIRDFNDYTNSTNIDTSTLLYKIDALISRLDESLTVYNQPIPSNTDTQTQTATTTIIQGISDYDAGLKQLRDAENSNDNTAITNATSQLQKGIDEINSGNNSIVAIADQQQQSVQSTKILYIWGTGIFVFISLVLFILSRKKSKYPSEQQKIKLYGQLFLTSLWPTIGFLITLISYTSTKSGNYTIATGAILFGTISLIRQLYAYFKKVKPELDIYIAAEKLLIDNYADLLRLYSTLSAEDFEHIIAGKYNVNHKVSKFLHSRIHEYINSARTQAQQVNYDPYEIMEVNKTDSLETIKAKYRELAKKYHPDISKSNTEAQFKQINDAYTTILKERGVSK